MVVDELLGLLKARGLILIPRGSQLILKGPAEMRTPKLMKVIARQRNRLTEYFGVYEEKTHKRLVFYRMKSGQLLYKLTEGPRGKPPYGADAWSDSDKGPWRDLGGTWSEDTNGAVQWKWA